MENSYVGKSSTYGPAKIRMSLDPATTAMTNSNIFLTIISGTSVAAFVELELALQME